MAGIFESRNVPEGFIKCGGFFDELRNSQRLKNVLSYLISINNVTTCYRVSENCEQ